MVASRSAKTDPQSEASLPQLMDDQDVALILKIAPKTVHKLLRKLGCLPVTEKDRRFTIDPVQTHIDSRTVQVSSGGQSDTAVQDSIDGEPE
jgi:hypothetical protein